MPPDVLSRETEDRREPPYQRLDNVIHGRLRRAPGPTVGLGRVLPVLDDIEIEAAHVDSTKVMNLLKDSVKFAGLIVLHEFGL